MNGIYVTKTFLPPIEEYQAYVNKIWDSNHVTNNGPLLREFESKTSEHLDVKNFQFVSNGTIAIQIALNALSITDGEIITTPFSYVASTSAILWERCEPVFVDINPENFCIDPSKIEAAITDKTRAILAVHVFGNACDVEEIEKIANRHNLKVIYDGAHAFGSKYNNKSLLSYGDISTCSFHATKLFHTIEGGAVIAKDNVINKKVDLIKRFGHHGDEHFMLGINAKPNELQAAMGLCNLKYVDDIIKSRKLVSSMYDNILEDIFQKQQINPNMEYNYAYYPVLFKSEKDLLNTLKNLNEENIYPRRYFYPSLNTLPYLKKNQRCTVSEDIAKRVLCLPIYYGLDSEIIGQICEIATK